LIFNINSLLEPLLLLTDKESTYLSYYSRTSVVFNNISILLAIKFILRTY